MIPAILKTTISIAGLVALVEKVIKNFEEVFTFNEFIFDSTIKNFTPNMSLKEVADKCSPTVDEIIIKGAKAGWIFQKGRFKISAISNISFNIGIEFYFQNIDGEWGKLQKTSDVLKSSKYLSSKAYIELNQVDEKIYPVAAPEPNNSNPEI